MVSNNNNINIYTTLSIYSRYFNAIILCNDINYSLFDNHNVNNMYDVRKKYT